MRWIAYFILAYLMLGLQIGLSGHVSIGGAWPNLVLLAVIFIAINAPRDAALLGCLGLGLLQDLATEQTLGVFALSYGLVAMLTVSTQQLVYRGHPLTHFWLPLMGALMTGVVMLLHGWVGRFPGPRLSPMTLFYSSLYTAALGPMVLGILHRIRSGFAFQPSRRKIRL